MISDGSKFTDGRLNWTISSLDPGPAQRLAAVQLFSLSLNSVRISSNIELSVEAAVAGDTLCKFE